MERWYTSSFWKWSMFELSAARVRRLRHRSRRRSRPRCRSRSGRELQTYYRNRNGQPKGQIGTVTFIQRFNSSLALSPHFHVIAMDGVFVEDAAHGLRFSEAGEPSKLGVAEIVSAVHARIHAELRRVGLEEQDEDGQDALAADSPALAACYAGSVRRRVALVPNAGKAVSRLGANPNALWIERDKPRHGHYEGFDLHADVAIGADDRQGLEQLLRWFSSRRPSSSGSPRWCLDRTRISPFYGGVLAPNAKLRSKVVAYGSNAQPTQARVAATEAEGRADDALDHGKSAQPQPAAWAAAASA